MLRANRPATPVGAAPQTAPQQPAQAPQSQAQAPVQPSMQNPAQAPQSQAQAPVQPPMQQAAPQQPAYTPGPAPQYNTQAPAVQPETAQVPANTNANQVAAVNQGVLENMDDIGNIGNFVTIDGSEFLYKASDRRVAYIDANIHYGKRYYQWVDETNPQAKQYHNSDTKLDDRYKLKGEVRWYEPGEEGEEPTEYIHSLSTTSMIQFLDYLKKLAKAALGVNQVWTRMTISRHQRPNSSERYSRADFEAFSLQDGQPLNIRSNA